MYRFPVSLSFLLVLCTHSSLKSLEKFFTLGRNRSLTLVLSRKLLTLNLHNQSVGKQAPQLEKSVEIKGVTFYGNWGVASLGERNTKIWFYQLY